MLITQPAAGLAVVVAGQENTSERGKRNMVKRITDGLFYTVAGRWCLVLVGFLVVAGGVLVAQDAAGTPQAADLPQLTSTGAVAAAAIMVTYLLKNSLANVPWLSALPVWVYVVVTALGLTFLANRITGTLQGDFLTLAVQAVYNAAMASGFREWVHSGVTKPLAASTAGGQ